ncbi:MULTISPECIES: cysteine desulfurase DndA [Mycobacterium]|uniref:cysteine desulfurase n=1 Tax=Mycobacterium syngnathidarum TaxID=1908205 RepID=A0A1Q9W3X7_9MYCO|nr:MULTISPECIES: cysteine desulfurase DndA [Mycobacterium]MCG7607953.1 cysteine desulfurase DndA [Mycobacterium sp. CnD-18-1]OHT93331.1 cysteine desulfurase DndA [Mycobacterium syngnathidarum]OLT88102.1 cysteine desulfurase DndA [Mycobacterium syngnathidarum]
MTVTIATDKPSDPAGQSSLRPVYLDFNATTPVDERVAKEVMAYLSYEFGNAGSRTHTYGQVAKERVHRARAEVAAVVSAKSDEVVFTSGATESNNIAILGLESHGIATSKRHIISTQIEHKAVLEPLEVLRKRGFDVELLPPNKGGWVSADRVEAAVREDTLLVSVMAVNNETGVIQPVNEIASVLANHEAYFHVDAAQAFGKLIDLLREPRIDLISLSGHKIGAPKGIGALIARRRGFKRPPLEPLMYGGGQERGLRPGTLPVALVAGLGLAAKLAAEESAERTRVCQDTKRELLDALEPLGIALNGDPSRTIASALNFSVPGIDSEAAIVALKDVVAISNGSACTSQSYEPSHVLTAAGLSDDRIAGALRVSWGAETNDVPLAEMARRLASLR